MMNGRRIGSRVTTKQNKPQIVCSDSGGQCKFLCDSEHSPQSFCSCLHFLLQIRAFKQNKASQLIKLINSKCSHP